MHRKKDRRLYIDGCMAEGATNRESLDNQYGYLSVNSSFRINSELRMVFSREVARFVPGCI